MTGTVASPSFLAASSRPWPAMMPFSPSTRIGLVQPNARMEAAICGDLGGGVGAGVAGIGDQLIQGPVLDGEVAGRRGRERVALCSDLRSTAELVD